MIVDQQTIEESVGFVPAAKTTARASPPIRVLEPCVDGVFVLEQPPPPQQVTGGVGDCCSST